LKTSCNYNSHIIQYTQITQLLHTPFTRMGHRQLPTPTRSSADTDKHAQRI